MNAPLRARWGRAAILLLPALAVLIIFRRIIACADCYLFVNSSDGLKNYFTFAWYLKYDSGLWFTGMNYPYGEHILFTDNQPAWALFFNAIDSLGIPISEYPVAVMNLLLVFSLLAAIYVLIVLFRQFRLPLWYAVPVATFLIFLSPQIIRFHGHYSLAHLLYLPLLLLFIFRLKRSPGWLRAGILTVALVWMSLTHAYFFLITMLFLGVYFIIDLLMQKRSGANFRIYLAGVILASVCSFIAFVQITDPVSDRPQEAFGVDQYASDFAGTFLPFYQGVGPALEHTLGIREPNIEAKSYVGIVPAIFLVCLIISMILRRSMRRHFKNSLFFNWLLAAALVWVFSTGILSYEPLHFISDAIPPLKQFRSLGRLAWIFYYTLGLSAAIIIYYWFRGFIIKQRFIAGYVILAIAIGLWCFEAIKYAGPILKNIYNPNITFSQSDNRYIDFLNLKDFSVNEIQGQLLLPLFMVGPEKLSHTQGLWSMRIAMQSAWQTGIPVIDFNLSRTSVSQSLNLLQLTGPDFLRKERAFDMDDRPILLLVENEFTSTQEKEFAAQATSLGSIGSVDLYLLEMAKLREYFSARKYLAELCRTTPFEETFIFDDFEDQKFFPADAYQGAGAFRIVTEDTTILSVEGEDLEDHFNYVLSFWALVTAEVNPPYLEHSELDKNGEVIRKNVFSYHDFYPCDVMGDWLKFTYWFDPGNTVKHAFKLFTKGAVIDNLMLRIDSATICRSSYEGDSLMYNNFWLPMDIE